MAAVRQVLANRVRSTTNFLMCRRDNQNTPRRISGHFAVKVSDSASTFNKWNFVHSTEAFQLFEALFWGLTQGLNGVPVLCLRLTLDASE
jgi:hypothetical protein